MIRGIDPAYAKKPLRAFGEKVFDSDFVMTQHYAMLQRNLLYTGVTRGKRSRYWLDRRRPSLSRCATSQAGGVGRSWRNGRARGSLEA